MGLKIDTSKINLIPLLEKSYKEDFKKGKNIIGVSDLVYGQRKTVIKKCYEIKKETTMKMLCGKMVHKIFQSEPLLSYLIETINNSLPYNFKKVNGNIFYELDNGNYSLQQIKPELETYTNLGNNTLLRSHPDIFTSLYIIEIKYTGIYYKDFIKEEYLNRIIHYQIQLNTYLGLHGINLGFLLIINAGIWSTSSTSFDFVWNNYCRLIPITFNKALFDLTIQRAKDLFTYIEKEDFITPSCPEFLWECDPKYCPVQLDCPIKITKLTYETYQVCEHCKEQIRPGLPTLNRLGKVWHYRDKEFKEGGIEMKECIEDCIKYRGDEK